MGEWWWYFTGIAGVLLLRANANASANGGNPAFQNVIASAMAYVPFPHAGSIGQTGNNPRNLNGNGQQIPVADPDANVINNGAQDAVLSTNFDASNSASLSGSPTFIWKDLATGKNTAQPTYWRSTPNYDEPTGGPLGGGFVSMWLAPVNYSGPSQMCNCPQPGSYPDASSLASSGVSW